MAIATASCLARTANDWFRGAATTRPSVRTYKYSIARLARKCSRFPVGTIAESGVWPLVQTAIALQVPLECGTGTMRQKCGTLILVRCCLLLSTLKHLGVWPLALTGSVWPVLLTTKQCGYGTPRQDKNFY